MRIQYYNNLRVFNLAAQYSSFATAALKLNLTKGAISYQIKELEGELGFLLFHRLPNGVELTSKGKELQSTLQPTFKTIEQQIEILKRDNTSKLTIGVPTYFASRCLSPLLMNFLQSYPTVRLRIQPMVDVDDIEGQNIDLAIRWGRGDWSNAPVEPLIQCPAFPVGNKEAMDHVDEHGLEAAFNNFTLLNDSDTSSAWMDWYSEAEFTFPTKVDSLVIPDPNVRVQAVIDGQGVSLNDRFIEKELSERKLFRLSDFQLENYGYFLVYPSKSRHDPNVETFAKWLLEELS